MVEEVDDPLGDDDLQLALYLCFELHYRCFAGVDPAWEWRPDLLAVRAVLEEAFFDALEAEVGPGEPVDPDEVGDLLFRARSRRRGRLALAPARGRGRPRAVPRVRRPPLALPAEGGRPAQLGDPAARRPGEDGAAGGAGRRVRRRPAASGCTRRSSPRRCGRSASTTARTPTSTASRRDPGDGQPDVGARACAASRRGAIVGHLAMFEMTSAQPNRRYGNALRRLGFDARGDRLLRRARRGRRGAREHRRLRPRRRPGARRSRSWPRTSSSAPGPCSILEDRFARHLLAAWEQGETSLRRPLRR